MNAFHECFDAVGRRILRDNNKANSLLPSVKGNFNQNGESFDGEEAPEAKENEPRLNNDELEGINADQSSPRF